MTTHMLTTEIFLVRAVRHFLYLVHKKLSVGRFTQGDVPVHDKRLKECNE